MPSHAHFCLWRGMFLKCQQWVQNKTWSLSHEHPASCPLSTTKNCEGNELSKQLHRFFCQENVRHLSKGREHSLWHRNSLFSLMKRHPEKSISESFYHHWTRCLLAKRNEQSDFHCGLLIMLIEEQSKCIKKHNINVLKCAFLEWSKCLNLGKTPVEVSNVEQHGGLALSSAAEKLQAFAPSTAFPLSRGPKTDWVAPPPLNASSFAAPLLPCQYVLGHCRVGRPIHDPPLLFLNKRFFSSKILQQMR